MAPLYSLRFLRVSFLAAILTVNLSIVLEPSIMHFFRAALVLVLTSSLGTFAMEGLRCKCPGTSAPVDREMTGEFCGGIHNPAKKKRPEVERYLKWCYNKAQDYCDLDGQESEKWTVFKNLCTEYGKSMTGKPYGCWWTQC